ncbi:hypothetical protein [Streptomyces sp. NPDC059862]|uniref:hypothetical protein n=1 Tax=unclassified Streptomyces TaxID=2593676 RepID=UPI00363F09B3
MAHAAPTAGGTTGAAGTPDIFSARTHRIAKWAVPVVLGLVYGYWAAANQRDGGPITGWNLLLGFVAALAFAVVYFALLRLGPRMRREVHALAWMAFAGVAFGFVYSQTGATALRSTVMALAVAATVFAILFYRYYTREDAEGRRVS